MSRISRLRTYAKTHGWGYTLRRLGEKAGQEIFGTWDRQWRQEKVTEEEKQRQRENPPAAGLLSVVIPVYNTKEIYLQELLSSLRAQSYENWEAILYDGGSDRPETIALLDRAAGEDPRFRVVHGKRNLGIAGNTNAAIALARGEYIALCDHDDVLTPDALWQMGEAIAREHPDLLYSDEDMMTENGRRHMDPHRKPEFQPETLAADNYLSHLGVIRTETLRQVGGFREGYDGSQDHELYLRIAARTDRIVHVPYILYSWRKLSTSLSRQHLDQCLWAGCRANEDLSPIPVVAIPVDQKIRLWYDFPRGKKVEAIIFCSDEEGCRAAWEDLNAQAPWPNLQATLAVTDLEGLYDTLNQAAAESEADYLLFLDAAGMVETRHFFRELLMYAQKDGVAGVTPVLVDGKNRISFGGWVNGRNDQMGLKNGAGGPRDRMNKVHNVEGCCPCCMMVRRDQFVPFGTRDETKRYVYTPHAAFLYEDMAVIQRSPFDDGRE
ncbi:MAG: glycosyltransferase [Clostridia bacterium]|nr:glycosyltransferase [Clostridia bacterium]